MPIILTESSWDQDESNVFLILTLLNASSADIFTTPRYIKVLCSPYLYEAYLFDAIDDTKSNAEISRTHITFRLAKREPKHWPFLLHNDAKNPDVMRNIRAEAIEYAAARSSVEAELKGTRRREKQGFAVAEHTAVQNSRKVLVHEVKEQQKADLLSSYFGPRVQTIENSDQCSNNSSDDETEKSLLQSLGLTEGPAERSDDSNEAVYMDDAYDELLQKIAAVDDRNGRSKTAKLKKAEIPAIRSSGAISFTSTPRVFPTPRRESKMAEEEEWLRKQASYRTILDNQTESLKLCPSERDPVLLKVKGDAFLTSKDYDSALSCYGLVIHLHCKMPEIYMNRGLCHLLKGNLHKVLEDMERALEYYDPPVEDNMQERMKAYWRRGIAFFGLDLYVECLVELNGALKLDCQSAELQKGIERVRELIQSGDSKQEYRWMMVDEVIAVS